MAILVSAVFIAALLMALAASIGTLASSAPQITDAISGRHGINNAPRVVRIGQVKHIPAYVSLGANVIAFKARPVANVAAHNPAHNAIAA